MKPKTNTSIERDALPSRSNLSDGHARLDLDSVERNIFSRSLEILENCFRQGQNEVETRFLETFFGDVEHIPEMNKNTFISYASSSSIKIVAQVARIEGKKILLVEPCFDNIYHILNTEGLNISPVDERDLDDRYDQLGEIDSATLVWLVLPNNPTGVWMSEAALERIAVHLASRHATLVIDLCFKRFVSSENTFDLYDVLKRAGVDYITIEDTGKTWSLGDLKVGVTVCSERYSSIIRRLHDELLLSVSPFTLEILTQFIEYWASQTGSRSFAERAQKNRNLVDSLAEQGEFSFVGCSEKNVPMVLLRVDNGMSLHENWDALRKRGVELLPTTNYFWSGAPDYLRAFRVPILKPFEEIEIACSELLRLTSKPGA